MAMKSRPTHSSPQQLKRRNRCLYLVSFFLIKGMITLALLNFYMGAKLEHVEQSLTAMVMMMGGHSSRRDGSNNNGIKIVSVENKDSPSSIDAKIMTQQKINIREDDLPIKKQLINSTKQFNDGEMITPNLSDGTLQEKERLWNILTTRNITQIEANYWASVPTWESIIHNIQHSKSRNKAPIIQGLETCQQFQEMTSSNPSNRRIAPAGLFNTGTNYLSVLLDYNCQNPHRVAKFNGNAKRGHGNEWEVPWGKHTPPHFRGNYNKNAKSQFTIDEVLPIVLVRNPYGWMKSMCRNPYTAKWEGMHNKNTCPQLKKSNGEWNTVDANFGPGATHYHQSLGHLWNDWYGEYFYKNYTAANNNKDATAPFPRLIIRFEDIIFFPYEVTKQICMCAGGTLGHRQDDKDVVNGTFHYVVRSAKVGVGHGPASQRNGLIDSWVRYGRGDPKDEYGREETSLVQDVLDPLMMETFEYSR